MKEIKLEPKECRKKEIIKIIAGDNDNEARKTIEEINGRLLYEMLGCSLIDLWLLRAR